MRFASFRLVRYGHFDDRKVLFPKPCAGQADLHVVFGCNEAGKSTMQAGLIDFLFGRGKSTSYQFRYVQGGILEAEVEIGDQNFVLQRRIDPNPKGRGSRQKDALCLSSGKRFTNPILVKTLAGLTREDYQRVLALDHLRLQISGSEFLEFDLFSVESKEKAKSGITAAERRWDSFFDQATGIKYYANRQKELQKKAEQHLKWSNGKILKSCYLAAEQEYNKWCKQLGAERQKLDNGLAQYQEACQRQQQSVSELQDYEQELEWLDRLVQIAPSLERADQLEAECGSVQSVEQSVRFPLDAMEMVTRASQQLVDGAMQLQPQSHAQRALLTHAEQIEQLSAQAAKCADFPEQIAKRVRDISSIQERVEQRRQHLGCDAAKVQLLPTCRQRELLLGLLDNHKDLEPLLAQVTRLRSEHPWLVGESGSGDVGFASSLERSKSYQLRQVLERVHLLGDIEAKMSELRDAVDQTDQVWQASFKVLHPWSGTEDDLRCLNPPAQVLVRSLSEIREKIEDSETDLAKLQSQLALTRQPKQPVDNLARSPAITARCWSTTPVQMAVLSLLVGIAAVVIGLLGSLWLDTPLGPSIVVTALIGFSLAALSSFLLQQVRRRRQDIWAELKQTWDADQRFASAGIVVDRLASEIEQLQEREQLAEHALAVTWNQFREQNASWGTLMASLGLAGLAVNDYQNWLARRDKALEQRRRGDRTRQDYRRFVEDVERVRQELLSELVRVGQLGVLQQQSLGQPEQPEFFQQKRVQPSDAPEYALSQLMALADKYLTDQLHQSGRRAQLRCDYQQATSELQEQEQTYQLWQDKWLQAVAGCSLPADIDLRSVRAAVECMKDLEGDLERIEDIKVTRIGTMRRDLTALERTAGELIGEIAADIPQVLSKRGSVFENERLLVDLLEKARREDLIRQDREQRRAETLAKLKPLFVLAGIDIGLEGSVSELESVIRRSQQLEDLDRCRTDIVNAAGEHDQDYYLAEIRKALATQPLETYHQRQCQVKQQLSASRVKRESTSKQVEHECQQLECIEVHIAQLEVQKRAALAEMERNVHSYLGLTLRASLLGRAVKHHRRERQDALMERVGHYLQAMTGNSFGTLEPGDNLQPVPQVVRADTGEVVKFQGLSEGTRDQLFLALCLSESERRLERHQLPLLADSLFVNFDDERTVGGFRALRELGWRTQVIYFTHHRHLVDLAQDALGEDLNVVELERLKF